MLIRFRVQNFLSFKDEVEFSMIPGRTRIHPNHIVSGGTGRNAVNLLRAGVVYGANASGKSNLIKAISFAKRFILRGVKAGKKLPFRPFKLDASFAKRPTKFEFEIRQNGTDYLYGFEIDNDVVIEEWLHQIKKTTTVKIFERITNAKRKAIVTFDNIKYADGQNEDFLKLVALGTRPNQLFLNESIDSNVEYFKDVFSWFENLAIIYPESRSDLDLDISNENTIATVDYLEKSGTGVCGFGLQKVSPEVELPEGLLDAILEELKPGDETSIMERVRGQRYLLKKAKQGKVEMSKFMLKHKVGNSQEEIFFDTEEESDGTIRLMDLLPIVTSPQDTSKVYVIDELDRSLHPNLSYDLIQDFLSQDSHNQILVTTHDANLLSFDLLRRDEIWFVEKDQGGATSLYSLEEFTPRYDKNIRRGYLKGRFGAIPMIGKKTF